MLQEPDKMMDTGLSLTVCNVNCMANVSKTMSTKQCQRFSKIKQATAKQRNTRWMYLQYWYASHQCSMEVAKLLAF